jgi:hypothetical protein
VATDDVEVAETVAPLAANLGLRARLLPINRTKYGEGNAQGANRHADLIEERGDLDRAVAAREVYADVLGLARCDAIVGPFHSTMDLLVFELQTARLGCVRFYSRARGKTTRRRPPPFISMDDPWCSDDPANANNFCPDQRLVAVTISRGLGREHNEKSSPSCLVGPDYVPPMARERQRPVWP